MSTLQKLMAVCQAEGAALTDRAQTNTERWNAWLLPLSESAPVGEDPAYDDDFQLLREEINRLSGMDTRLISELSEKLLTTVCKDIRVATFYTWARLQEDGDSGLAEGLELLAGMLQRFGADLHPLRPSSRKNALAWLSGPKMLDSLARWPEADLQVTQRVAGALLLAEAALLPEEAESSPFAGLSQTLVTRLERCGGSPAPSPRSVDDVVTNAMASPQGATPVSTKITNSRELLDQARLMAGWLREQPQGWLAGHHLMKAVRWAQVDQLPALDASGRTRLAAPKPEHRAQLKRLFLQQSWTELRALTDDLFMQGVNHLWLDVQWYVWQALVNTGNDSVLAGIVRNDLLGLLRRLPGLESLTFSDGTPFADEVTLSWIQQEVLNEDSGMQVQQVTATSHTDNDILELESEAQAMADSDGLDTALGWLQHRPGVVTDRDRWLMQLLMARLAEQYGKNALALHLLGELHSRARSLTLRHWEPELLFEVKARKLKLLRQLAGRSETEKARLQPDMDTLLAGLVAIDPVRAAVLCA
ncbi:type VI secretion system protein TssA [Citrobacter braakii]|uniref:type VI secretion system protein TssA n=1 Tax=Citrobacter braakii TaxID=57706 RepID=UPI0011ECCE91|nr:type VI secretion system protein TssA [Citrobacter braakii]